MSVFGKVKDFYYNRGIVIHLLVMAVISVLLYLILSLSLRFYTNHGTKVEMSNFVVLSIEEAKEQARSNKFDLIINDSVYIVDAEGGKVIRQSPNEGSIVKKGRKVYLTVTKSVAEEVTSALFPDMYGKSYDNIEVLLNRRFNLKSEIRKKVFDPGPKDVVLEAYFGDVVLVNDEMQNREVKIPKGATIEFVLSQREKGPIQVPEFKCLKYEAVSFVLKSNELKLGNVHVDSTVGSDTASAFVVRQDPVAGAEKTINIGGRVDIYLSGIKDANCP